jgi:hypothetical protein
MQYITVYKSIGGWKAVHMMVIDGNLEPQLTGFGGYDTPAKAEVEAEAWATAERLPFVKHNEGICRDCGKVYPTPAPAKCGC